LDVAHCPNIQHSTKIGNYMATTHNHIQISSVPPFTGFKPIDNFQATYYRDAYFGRAGLENEAAEVIRKNYKIYKANVLWRWWSSAKKIKRAFKLYKWQRSCAEYVRFVAKVKRKRAQRRRRNKEIFQRMFQKIRNSAIKIQRIWRGYVGRNAANVILDDITSTISIQAAFRGMRVRLQDHIWVRKKKVSSLTSLHSKW
tara:strand:- start:144 stop:740 length:597 start_codon:yes stop_codon:yes gene_type:complete